ncbi:MAG: PilZ domain-containing protein [Nitrospirota bacterium]
MANPAIESDRRYETVSISFPDRRAEPRRRFRRFLISLPVSCRDRAKLVESYSLDIGLGGIALLAEQSAPIGGELILQFSFSPDLYVEFHSEVVHASESTELSRQATVGLQFIRGTDTERKALASYLAGIANMTIQPPAAWTAPGLWHRSEFLSSRLITMDPSAGPPGQPGWPGGWERQVQEEFVRAVIPPELAENGLRLITVEGTIRHVIGAAPEATLLLRLKVSAIKRATVNLQLFFVNPGTGQIIAEGQQVLAFANPGGRLIPVPSEFLAHYRQRFI